MIVFGFVLLFSCSGEKQRTVTFSSDIAPLIYRSCLPCHREDGIGHLPLVTYEQVREKAKMIKFVTETGYMPPWPADTTYTRFTDEKILNQNEIALIRKWVENGMPLGNASEAPPVPALPKGSYLGKPDLVVKMDKPFFLKGNGQDKFLFMKFPYEMSKDTFIRAIEFVPGNTKMVHHVNGFLVQYESDKKKNVFDGKRFVDIEKNDVHQAFDSLKLANDDGKTFPTLTPSVVNYLPGVLPTVYPEGIGGFTMKSKGAIFLKDIHYGPGNADTYDSSYFNVFFDRQPPKRKTMELQLGTLGRKEAPIAPPLVVPADSVKTVRVRFVVDPEAVHCNAMSILTVNPHMHLLGKSYLAYAITPANDTIRLVRIKKWDFRWQYFYTFKKPVIVPAGSTIVVEGVYDNTKNNPVNPFSPPRQVSERNGSMRSSDEMFQFIITYLPYAPGDENLDLEKNPLRK